MSSIEHPRERRNLGRAGVITNFWSGSTDPNAQKGCAASIRWRLTTETRAIAHSMSADTQD